MNRNKFVKELRDYFSIFTSFLIIFVLFSNNMSFAAASCADIDSDGITKREHCRDYGERPFTIGGEDLDGNRPITCRNVSLEYDPFTSDDYYYEQGNRLCLAWALGISISYSVLSIAAGYGCTVNGAPTGVAQTAQKAAKLAKLKNVLKIIGKAGSNVVEGATSAASSALLSDPVVSLEFEFGIDAIVIGGKLIWNTGACAGSFGLNAVACGAAGACAGFLAGLTAASQSLIFGTTGGLYNTAKEQINKVKVCGDDWNSYAYTEYDMKEPKNEWYPQYGSFSNSYSYKVNKIVKGEYSCVGYLKDDNGGKNNVELTTAANNCDESCKSEVNNCMINQRKTNGTINLDKCLTASSTCTSYCKGYFAKCEPIIDLLNDSDGVCKDNNGSTYSRDNEKDLFKCKGVKSNYKNSRNKFYRESIYKGKEFKIAVKYNDSSDCIDPRLDSQKGYAGLEQRYYFRGKEAAQYACNRFKYTYNGCRLSDGTVITREEAAADPTKDLKCRQAFQDANTCCQNRRALGICIYNSSGKKSDRDNNALCMRNLDSTKRSDECSLDTGSINNPTFMAHQGVVDSTQICVSNTNYCPYAYNVAGGTELQELYCAGDNNCTDCVDEEGNKDDKWQGTTKYRDKKGRIKKEYRYTIPLCSDRDAIWKKNKYKYPTAAYGNVKNFCRYRAHCTEIGDSDYEFANMTSNKFLPKACSDFVGDSQNLPYPVKVADISMSGSVKSIFKKAGVNIGDGSLNSIYAAIDKMSTPQLAEVYSKIMAERAIISLVVGSIGGSFGGPLAGIITSASAGTLYSIQDIKNAVESDGNSKTTLKAIVKDVVGKPLISGVNFSLGEYRGFTAPIAQCIKETLNNMFLNKAGQSICAKQGEEINSEGLCGNDTFGPPENIRKDAYIQIIGEKLPDDSNIFYKIQTRLQNIIKLVAVLAIIVIGLKFLMKGDLDIFDIKKPKAIIVGMLKFAIVFYFAVGNAWQSQFYEWLDKATQYLYYKSFNLSLVGYKDYKNQADKTTCKVETKGKVCREYTYQVPIQIEKKVEKENHVCKTFSHTGGDQTFTVPDNVSELKLEVWGGKGGDALYSDPYDGHNMDVYGGRGGYSYGTLAVSPKQVLTVIVGNSGDTDTSYCTGAGGGGGSAILRNGKLLIVAGGGGGAGSALIGAVGGGYGGGGKESGGNSLGDRCESTAGSNGIGGKDSQYGSPGQDGQSRSGGSGYGTGQNLNSLTSYSSVSKLSSDNYVIIYGGGGYGAGGNSAIFDMNSLTCYGSSGGGGGYGGGAGGNSHCGGAGGGGYIGGVVNGGGSSGTNSGNGKAQICYTEKYTETEIVTEYEDKTESYCRYDVLSTENNKEITDLDDLPSPMPTDSNEVCNTYLAGTDKEYQQCYSECKTGPDYDENGNQVFDYSDTYDGCYFGDNVYPEGKSYLAIFDSLDCKLMNYFGYGPDVDLPGILHMLLISMIFSPLALVTVILGSILFVILLVIVIKVLHLFLMSMIAINIMVYVSPIIFPTLLFDKYKGIFNKWLDNLIGFCLQFVFVIIFTGFLIGNLDKFAIGSARWVGHDRTTGRLPTLVCGDATDSVVCIFKVNTNKGTKPMLGEKIGKFLGIGPVVSLVDSISRDFSGTVMTLLKFCLIIYVFMEFLKKIPGVAEELVGGKALDTNQASVGQIMNKIKDTTDTITRGAKGAIKKGAKSVGGLASKVKSKKQEADETRKDGREINDRNLNNNNGKDGNNGELGAVNVKKQSPESGAAGSSEKESK